MLENIWYVVLESKEVKKGKLLGVKRLNKNLLFYRVDDKVVCIEDKCSHRGTKLSLGNLNKNCVACPFHGFEFNEEGQCISIPANGQNSKVSNRFNIKTYPTHERDGFIFIYNGKSTNSKPEYFEELETVFTKTTSRTLWNTHYSRAIENQLDVVHLPFVHKKTIGKANKRLVNGPKIKVDNNKMTIFVFNEIDKGQSPLKAKDMVGDDYFKLKFIMPNIWQNLISDKLRISIAFVPIDEEKTYIYLRSYQKIIQAPILKNIFMLALKKYNNIILAEDYRVVSSQRPLNTHKNIKENLIPGDLPIGTYRNWVKKINQQNEGTLLTKKE